MASNANLPLNSEPTNDNRAKVTKGKESKGRKSMGLGRKFLGWTAVAVMLMGAFTIANAATEKIWYKNGNDGKEWNDQDARFYLNGETPGNTWKFVTGNIAHFDTPSSSPYTIKVGTDSSHNNGVTVGGMHVGSGLTFVGNKIYSIKNTTNGQHGKLLVSTDANNPTYFQTELQFAGGAEIDGYGDTVLYKTYSFGDPINIHQDATLNLQGSSEIFSGTGQLTGTGSVKKFNAGTITLSGIGTGFGGNVSVEGGTLAISGTGGFGGAKSLKVLNNSELDLTGVPASFLTNNLDVVNATGKVNINRQNLTLAITNYGNVADEISTINGVITGLGKVQIGDTGSNVGGKVLFNNGQDYDGGTDIQKGTLALGTSGSIKWGTALYVGDDGVLDLSGAGNTSHLFSTVTGTGDIEFSDSTYNAQSLYVTSGDSTFSGEISGLGNVIVSTDNTKWTLNSANTYQGITKVANKAKLVLGTNGSISNSAYVDLDGTTSSLDLTANTQQNYIRSLIGKGTVNTAANSILAITDGASKNFEGTIDGDGGFELRSGLSGVNQFVLSGTNTYKDRTIINNNAKLFVNGSIDKSSQVFVDQNGEMTIEGATDSVYVNELAGSGKVNTGSGKTLELHGTNNFSGDIYGNGNLETNGPVTFTSVQSYTGTTHIASGTLALSGDGDLNPTTKTHMTISDSGIFSIAGANHDVTLNSLKSDSYNSVVNTVAGQTLNLANGEEFKGKIEGGGNVTFGGGAGANKIFTLYNNDNGYRGITTVKTGNTLKLYNENGENGGQISDSSWLELDDGKLELAKRGIDPDVTFNSSIKAIEGTGMIQINDKNNLSLAGTSTTDGTMGNFTGAIQGNGNLNLNGINQTFDLTRTNNTSFTGKTNVNAGILALHGGTTLNDSSGTNLTGSGKLDLSGISATTFEFNNNNVLTTGSNTAIDLGHKSINFNNRQDNQISGIINGSDVDSTMTVINSSKVTLGGTINAFKSITISDNGILTNDGVLNSKTVWVGNLGTVNNNQTINGDVTVKGNFTNSGTIIGKVTADTSSGVFVADGVVNGNVKIDNGATFEHYDNSSTDVNQSRVNGNFESTSTSNLYFDLRGSTSDTRVEVRDQANVGGNLKVYSSSAGRYNLFSANHNNIQNNVNNTIVANGGVTGNYTSNLQLIKTNTTDYLQLSLLGAGQYMQDWLDSTGNHLWDTTSNNWSDEESYNNNTPTTSGDYPWSNNRPGKVAYFGDVSDPASKTVTVSNGINFDTIQFASDGYTLTDVNSGGNLTFWTAGTDNTAKINVTGSTVTARISTQLKENVNPGVGHNLLVTGGGTLILDNGNNYWSGFTKVDKSTTMQLDNLSAIGDGNVILSSDGGATLAFNPISGTTTWSKYIQDQSNSTGANIVDIMKSITISGWQDYKADTVVENDAVLSVVTAGDYYLSKYSNYRLNGNAILDLNNTTQEIGVLNGGIDSRVVLGDSGNLTATVNKDSSGSGTDTFTGSIKGGLDSVLVKKGNGDLTLYATNYEGALTATDGKLTINTINWPSSTYDLRIASANGANTNAGQIWVNSGVNTTNITGSNTFTGQVHVDHHDVTLNGNVLQNAGLYLDYTDANLILSGNYLVHNLTVNGGKIRFNGTGTDNQVLSKLGVDNLYGTGDLYLDTDALAGEIGGGGYNFFDNSAKKYFLTVANNIAQADLKNWEIFDSDGRNITGTDSSTYRIMQNGLYQGTATAVFDANIDTYGAYYQQNKVSKIYSEGNVEINGSNASTTDRKAVLDALLEGPGSYTFIGGKDILVSNNANNYRGTTYIKMNSGNSVYLGSGTVFSDFRPLVIESGILDLNQQILNVAEINGSGGSINFSSGLNIKTEYDGNYYGKLAGTGSIDKIGSGIQTFASVDNSLTGKVTVNGGGVTYAGRLFSRSSSDYAVQVNNGTFTQLNSKIQGNVLAAGSGSTFTGSGEILGNLSILKDARYLVGMASADTFNQTFVTDTTTFDPTTIVDFTKEAQAYIYKNPDSLYGDVLIHSGKKFETNNWQPEDIDMGILGSVDIAVENNDLVVNGYRDAADPAKAMVNSWAKRGINIGDVVSHSNIAYVDKDIVTTYLESDAIYQDGYLNRRFANAYAAGAVSKTKANGEFYSNDEVISLFNYQSGISAAIPVDAAMDVARNMIGRGLQNRITSLRAGRDTFATTYCPTASGCYAPVVGGGYNPGYGYGAAPQTSYATTSAYGDGSFGDSDLYGSTASTVTTDWTTYGGDTYVPATDLAPVYPAPAYGVPGYAGAILQQPALALERYRANRVWASGIGDWIKHDNTDGGIGGFNHNAGGLMLGYDHTLDKFTIGAALGYTHGKLEDKYGFGGDSKMDSYAFTAYGDYNFDSGLNLGFYAGYELFDNKIDRQVASYRYNGNGISNDYGREHEKYKSDAVLAGVNLSKDLVLNQRVTVTPSIGVTYTGVRSRSFDRNTDLISGVNLRDHFDSVKKNSLQIPLEVAGAYDVLVRPEQKLTLMANAGYAFECFNDGAKGGYNFADVADLPKTTFNGREPGRNNWNFGVGARYQYRNVDFDLRYDFTKSSDSHSNRIGAAIGIEF